MTFGSKQIRRIIGSPAVEASSYTARCSGPCVCTTSFSSPRRMQATASSNGVVVTRRNPCASSCSTTHDISSPRLGASVYFPNSPCSSLLGSTSTSPRVRPSSCHRWATSDGPGSACEQAGPRQRKPPRMMRSACTVSRAYRISERTEPGVRWLLRSSRQVALQLGEERVAHQVRRPIPLDHSDAPPLLE